MADMVEQKLRIDFPDGNKKILRKIKMALLNNKGEFDFERIIQPPENLFRGNLGQKEKEQCEKEGIPNWYDWNCDNWGTKWNACDSEIVKEESWCIEFKFSTAWDVPRPIIKKIFEMFPKLEIKYVAAISGNMSVYYRARDEEGNETEKYFEDEDFYYALDLAL